MIEQNAGGFAHQFGRLADKLRSDRRVLRRRFQNVEPLVMRPAQRMRVHHFEKTEFRPAFPRNQAKGEIGAAGKRRKKNICVKLNRPNRNHAFSLKNR